MNLEAAGEKALPSCAPAICCAVAVAYDCLVKLSCAAAVELSVKPVGMACADGRATGAATFRGCEAAPDLMLSLARRFLKDNKASKLLTGVTVTEIILINNNYYTFQLMMS